MYYYNLIVIKYINISLFKIILMGVFLWFYYKLSLSNII